MSQWAHFRAGDGRRMCALLESAPFATPTVGARVIEIIALDKAPQRTDLASLAKELVEELQTFVDSDGHTSYVSGEEKEAEHHVRRARALIARAKATILSADIEHEPPKR